MDKKKILLVSLGHLSCDINGGALPAILPFLRAAYDLSYQATGGLMFAVRAHLHPGMKLLKTASL
jgi:hypothetical protein